MKKIITVVSSILLATIVSASAEIGVGITGAIHKIDSSGSETLRTSAKKTTADHDETIIIPEIFVEGISDGGYALGISYIPTREVGDKSRTDVADATGREAGTYKAKAELDNVIQVYLDVPLMEVAGFQSYGKLGIQHATINTKESLNSGSTYGNEDIFGASIGLGVKGDLTYGEGLYYKGELSYTTFEDIELHNNVGNSIRAELDSYAAKFSVGKRF
jgi:hypothetical protein